MPYVGDFWNVLHSLHSKQPNLALLVLEWKYIIWLNLFAWTKKSFSTNKSQVPQICSNGELHPLQGKLSGKSFVPFGFFPLNIGAGLMKCSCWGLPPVGERCVPIQGLVTGLTVFIYVLFPVVVLFISVFFAILCVDLF